MKEKRAEKDYQRINSQHFPSRRNKIKPSEAFTGQEFCELIGIDYQAIIRERKEQDQKENIQFFCEELLKIEECKEIIEGILKDLERER